MDLYEQIDALVKQVHQERVNNAAERLAQYAEIEAVSDRLQSAVVALSQLVAGLCQAYGLSLDKEKQERGSKKK